MIIKAILTITAIIAVAYAFNIYCTLTKDVDREPFANEQNRSEQQREHWTYPYVRVERALTRTKGLGRVSTNTREDSLQVRKNAKSGATRREERTTRSVARKSFAFND